MLFLSEGAAVHKERPRFTALEGSVCYNDIEENRADTLICCATPGAEPEGRGNARFVKGRFYMTQIATFFLDFTLSTLLVLHHTLLRREV